MKAAGILTIVAASLCFIVGTIGLTEILSNSYPEYPGGSVPTYPYYYEMYSVQYVLTAVFGYFAFILRLGILRGPK